MHWFQNIKNKYMFNKYKNRANRYLEIGPHANRLQGFETLDLIPAKSVDYVADLTKKLFFPNDTFDLIYASHIIEHIPWFHVQSVFSELYRVLNYGGTLEVWVPDGLKICETLVDYERQGIDNSDKDGWYKFNEEKDPCKWASGRIFTYGDGTCNPLSPNWHRALFTSRYLVNVFMNSGFKAVSILDENEVRGINHGWISLGIKGIKK